MKKALAIVMALVIALSMSAMAFAAETTSKALTETCGNCGSIFESAEDLRAHIAAGCDGSVNECPHCQRTFADEAEYNKHIASCTLIPAPEKDYINLDLKELLTMIIELVKVNATQWDAIESVVIRLVDFIENMGTGLVAQADVEGAVADLEASLADIEIPGISDLLNQLKAKIKAMYAGEKATTVVTTVEETTEIEVPVDTGSATAGIAAFAAISVAAAAAYVCTKKKA